MFTLFVSSFFSSSHISTGLRVTTLQYVKIIETSFHTTVQQEHCELESEDHDDSRTDTSLSLQHAQLGKNNEKDSETIMSLFQEERKGKPDNPTCCGGKVDSGMSHSAQSR